jgi:hypothetical protein
MTSLVYEQPKNIDDIFSLDCFKFNEMKNIFKIIFANLKNFNSKITDFENKLIPIVNIEIPSI